MLTLIFLFQKCQTSEADSADIAEDTLKKTVVEEEVIEDDQE